MALNRLYVFEKTSICQITLFKVQSNIQKDHQVVGRLLGVPITMADLSLEIIKTIGHLFETNIKGLLNVCSAPFSKEDSPKLGTGAKQLLMGASALSFAPFLPLYIVIGIVVFPVLSLTCGSYAEKRAKFTNAPLEMYFS